MQAPVSRRRSWASTCAALPAFGQSSGSVEPFEVSRLSKGSNRLSGPVVFHYVAHRERLEAMAAALFEALAQGVLTAEPGKAFPLAQAAAAHEELEYRRAPGPLLLVP